MSLASLHHRITIWLRIPFLTILFCGSLSCDRKPQKSTLFGTAEASDTHYDLPQILQSGTILGITLKGPETYYTYRDQELGTHFLAAKQFARHIGAKLQMETASDTMSLYQILERGDADFIALCMPPHGKWITRSNTPLLQQAIDQWWNPTRLKAAARHQDVPRPVRKNKHPIMHNRTKGIISPYDHLLINAAQELQWDWRLLAAQCYQESSFDPFAESWTGALGLMQVMPSTAQEMNISVNQLTNPTTNIQTAARYLKRLQRNFADIPHPTERISFILAAYNGGALHIRDAMALTHKYGGNPHQWNDVREYVTRLAEPNFYNDPLVKTGYMRGSETEAYVRQIMERWQTYKRYARPHSRGSIPQPARRHIKDGKHLSNVKRPASDTTTTDNIHDTPKK